MNRKLLRMLLTDLVVYGSDGDEDGIRETFAELENQGLISKADEVIDELHRVLKCHEWGA